MTLVLVVDDEPLLRQLIESVLLDEGFRVILAGNGQDMLDVLETTRPDVILLDVMMPGLDGIEAFKVMQSHEQLRTIPVVMMSAAITREALHPAISAFMPKPFNIDNLLSIVDSVIRAPDA